MKKIPSLFVRDLETGVVTEEVTPGCEWVAEGRGRATEKLDGTACLVLDGRLFRRYDAKGEKGLGTYVTKRKLPPGFVPAQEPDFRTGHWPGWVPVDRDDQACKWHMEAWRRVVANMGRAPMDGTYELLGPKVNGNPYGLEEHGLALHGERPLVPAGHKDIARDYDGLKLFLAHAEIEGIVWHHKDGRMCKCKANDFYPDGERPWPPSAAAARG